ncbi:hypothetical protein ACLIKD_08895 [Azonexus sp. IMCC34842]|uniref:hypothetical protein n=1 Tax=Azonexus sp. IMCC34842 TaxID=3420950 RepID=UPI003D0A6B08
MDDLYKSHCRELERGEYAEVFRRLRKAFGPKPRLILAKSIVATKRKTIAPKRPVLVVRQAVPSDRELLGAISDACARGWITGTDALAAQRLLEQGHPLPKEVRNAILGRRS